MIDFHSHVLPGIDDGAESVQMSLDMLSQSYEQGVRTVVATPHYHFIDDSRIESFLESRKKSYDLLTEAMKKDERSFPQIVLGCELRAMHNLPESMESIRPLCIENTNYILVEMPYKSWNVNHYDFLYELLRAGMQPIMAHIERFRGHRKDFSNLFSLNLYYQVNADSIIHFPYKKFVSYLFEIRAVQLIGSDMHNTRFRSSHMDNAKKAIIKAYGESCFDYLLNNARLALENKPMQIINFSKKSIL